MAKSGLADPQSRSGRWMRWTVCCLANYANSSHHDPRVELPSECSLDEGRDRTSAGVRSDELTPTAWFPSVSGRDGLKRLA